MSKTVVLEFNDSYETAILYSDGTAESQWNGVDQIEKLTWRWNQELEKIEIQSYEREPIATSWWGSWERATEFYLEQLAANLITES